MRLFFLHALLFPYRESEWKSHCFTLGGNVIAALRLGIGHLPAAMKLGTLSTFEVSRILIGKTIPGSAFGWLYARNGIYSAMIAHFVTDIVYHVLLG